MNPIGASLWPIIGLFRSSSLKINRSHFRLKFNHNPFLTWAAASGRKQSGIHLRRLESSCQGRRPKSIIFKNSTANCFPRRIDMWLGVSCSTWIHGMKTNRSHRTFSISRAHEKFRKAHKCCGPRHETQKWKSCIFDAEIESETYSALHC